MPIKGYIWILVLGDSGGIALNNWFSIMGLFEKITTYDKVAESIYYGSLWMIFTRTVILAPLVEKKPETIRVSQKLITTLSTGDDILTFYATMGEVAMGANPTEVYKTIHNIT